MKIMRSAMISLAACGLVLGFTTALQAQTTQGKATVVRMKGEARYSDGKGGWQPLKLGAVLSPGTIVQTEQKDGAYVDLVLGDAFSGAAPTPVAFNAAAAARGGGASYAPVIEQNVVRLRENTMLGIEKLSTEQTGADVVTDTQLDLKAGHILGMVKKMNRASKYEIRLPKGVAGIRGTLYELWANGSGSVSAGSMVISLLDKDGNPQTPTVLNGGEQFDAATGSKSVMSGAAAEALDRAMAGIRVAVFAPVAPIQSVDSTSVQFVSPTKSRGKGNGNGHGNGGGNGQN